MQAGHSRTLVDLLDSEHGYVRVYSTADGFGYEVLAYRERPLPDLFERMSGYATLLEASEAARRQLAVLQPAPARGRRKTGTTARRRPPAAPAQLPIADPSSH